MSPAEQAALLAKMDAAELAERLAVVDELNAHTARIADPEADRRPRLRTVQGGRAEDGQPPPPLGLRPVRILKPNQIPHRQWIYGTHLIRGFVTLLVAPGGTGKSSLLLATCLSVATGRSLLGPRIFQPCNTALLNLEDPQDEIDRRITALAEHYHITDEEQAGRFFVLPPDRGVTIAASDGFAVWHPDEAEIIRQVRAQYIGVLVVDPFAESHTLEENSNPQMIQAAAAWRRVARACDCSVILSHHVRKGPVDSIEAARGAKALSDSARIGLLLSTMTDEEAKSLGIPEADRLQYVRMDDAKANMTPRATKATWFHLANVTLDNADQTYNHGDQVGVIEAWDAPDAWDAMTVMDANAILDRIARGPGAGELYTDSRKHPATRWAGNVVIEVLGYSQGQAATVIETWVRNGVLCPAEYKNADSKLRNGLKVVDAKRPGDRK
jgi:hypothetical protein